MLFARRLFSFVISLTVAVALDASETLDRARAFERSGDAAGARAALAQAAQAGPNNATALAEYAEFLDRYGDPGAREAYARLLGVLKRAGDNGRGAAAARRLAVLHLTAGDRAAAVKTLEEHRPTGGALAGAPAGWQAGAPQEAVHHVTVPGPLRPFQRMSAVSSDLGADEILGAVARNVVTNGYQASHSNDALEQTEYLKLVHRYLSQARELEKLANEDKVIRIENCDSPKVADLLRVLGFRMRGGCGSDVVLETVNATRAFLTTDSGFPLPDLEQALRTNRPFSYDMQPTRLGILYGVEYWAAGGKEKEGADFIDIFLSDPSLCRLYLGLSKLDRETAEEIRKAVPVQRFKAFAHVLDFFGGMFEIRGGKAAIPGGQRTVAAWTELVGAGPDSGAVFYERLLARDDGWLASFYDALLRIRGPVLEYLTEPERMKRFYLAVRGKVTSPGPARPVFRSNADMMLLTTRLRIDSSGRPHIPGGVEVWRNLFVNHPHGKYDGKLTRAATGWKEPDDVLEALFALCRKAVENEPLKIFMTISDLDRHRAAPLQPATVDRLARDYRTLGAQYAIFNDAPSVSDKSVLQFLDGAQAVNKLRDPMLRANAAGTYQALIGLWQIFARQGLLPPTAADAAFSGLVAPVLQVKDERELFDYGRNGVKLLLEATGSPAGAAPQDRMLELLAGVPAGEESAEAHGQIVQEMQRILDAQRIVSLNTLFETADHLESLSRGEKMNTALLNRLAGRISEIQLPRAALSGVEKNALAFGYWTERHVEAQRKLNLRAAIERAAGDGEKVKALRGHLLPFLRDTLVAYNYAHYAPPGAQVLYTNPLFVRGHDFQGVQGAVHTWRATELFGTGWPSNGGGRLVGSLAGLPYALAEAEQNFLVPAQTQALIWGDLVPQLILSAKIPRWWKVTPQQMHWVGLHMRYGQSLLAEAAIDADLRGQVLEILGRQAPPSRTLAIRQLLERGEVRAAYERATPAELFILAGEMAGQQRQPSSPCLAEIRRLASEHPNQIQTAAISRAFGTPKPTLANSYRPELLNLRTFPTLMGYSSRIMAESWESNTLYWASLADEIHAPPAQLNLLIPEWTQKVIERIFASHLEDWPALLRSLRLIGDDVRARARSQMNEQQKAASLQ